MATFWVTNIGFICLFYLSTFAYCCLYDGVWMCMCVYQSHDASFFFKNPYENREQYHIPNLMKSAKNVQLSLEWSELINTFIK